MTEHRSGGPAALRPRDVPAGPQLRDGSRVGIVGGGPAGAFFAYFLLELAATLGRRLEVDIHEARDFSQPAPAGCNMCGGIVSESLVQMLAAEGLVLPASVVQRGIDSYVLHTDVGPVRIATPLHEMRIGAVHRGLGPRDLREAKWESFDGFLLARARERGARVLHHRVERLDLHEGLPRVGVGEETTPYDLLVLAGGVNADAARLLEGLGLGVRPPGTERTFIREYFLGAETLARTLGNAMHVFLLDLPGLEFAAIIPKGEYATVCLLGDGVDKQLVETFMEHPAVRECFPDDVRLPQRSCQCLPYVSVDGPDRPFADRVLLLGDAGVTRLYKDGIGAAYRTAKVAAATAVLHGVSAAAFERYYRPAVRAIQQDNRLGRLAFMATGVIQRSRLAQRGLVHMTAAEQARPGATRHMSQALWDVFTGSAPYRRVVTRALHPGFAGHLLWSTVVAGLGAARPRARAAGAASPPAGTSSGEAS